MNNPSTDWIDNFFGILSGSCSSYDKENTWLVLLQDFWA